MQDEPKRAIQLYLSALRKALASGDSTEHTHRPALKVLVEQLAKGIVCVNEPKGTKAGHPDMKAMLGETPLGFIETKDVGLDLDEIEKSDQLQRYRKELTNLILTDYLQFRWYRNSEEVNRCALGIVTNSGKLKPNPDGDQRLIDMVTEFTRAEVKTIASPKELAQRMATLARMARRLIGEALAAEPENGDLHLQLRSFRETLLPDIAPETFADMYAQTIAYGLFASICNTDKPSGFARENAADLLPRTNPFLRQLFHHIVGPDLNEKVRWAVDQIVFLLKHADIASILKDFGKRTRQEDPVVHFYETFLAEYDPKLRKTRGVYYTPEPVVSFLIRSVDYILRTVFNRPLGLADPTVLALDPSTGTATFHHTNIKLIYERVREQGQYGQWSGYVRESLLPRLFGFELLMAPYAVAHLKLGLLLQETGYDFSGDERLGIYLTNTLEEAARKSDILFANWIADESNAAAGIKRDKPIMVIFGNPPYSGHSANKGEWIGGLVRDYYQVDGKPLGEKNPKWLQDDYVKFIRWGQWRIEKTGAGVLAFITNNGYLDNPTFRGMRQQLMRAFTDIYILDLHGSSKKKEKAPDGSNDENVFDIQQGVCIGIFVKEPGKSGPAQVHHAEVFGERESKYEFLLAKDVASVSWKALKPQAPFYLFVPQNMKLGAEYDGFVRVTDAMPLNVLGFQTHRDDFAIDFDEAVLRARIGELRSDDKSDEEIRALYGIPDNRDWHLADARTQLRKDQSWNDHFIRCLYRPFDWRPSYFSTTAMDYPRRELLDHVAGKKNLCLGLGRQGIAVNDPEWSLISVSREPIDANIFRRGGINVFPLYRYPVAGKKEKAGQTSTTSNDPAPKPSLTPEFVAEIEKRLALKFVPEQPEAESRKPSAVGSFGPEDVFSYIYAIFHSPTYRKRYAEFLKIDFPRVPLTSDKKLFRKLVELGGELVKLHLLESPKVDDFVTKYPKKGSDEVERVAFGPTTEGKGKDSAVWINDEQYFAGVKPEWWEFHIGGYQVLHKWLKDRKGRKLTNDDIRHYQRVVVAIKETIRLMAEIDKAIPKWPIE